MKDLIEALTILAKYKNEDHPTHCEHDCLYVVDIGAEVCAEDRERLNVLGFEFDEEDGWYSFRFGSA